MTSPSYISRDGAKESTPIAPEIRLYVEGVQVPFSDISISSVYGSLPSAQIVVPYLPYLQEIARNYRPKVHVFFMDYTNAVANYKQDREDDTVAVDLGLKLLFSGYIVQSHYSKSKSPFQSSSNISFTCIHKNSAVEELSMRMAAFGLQEGSTSAAVGEASANAPVSLLNPALLATQIVQGVDTTKSFDLSDPNKRDPSGIPTYIKDKYASNFKGIPGVILRLWNLMCTDAKNHANQSDIMQRLYVPLITNIRFFDGIAAHKSLEAFLESKRADISQGDLDRTGLAGAGIGANPGTALSPMKASFASLDAFIASVQIQSLQGLLENNASSISFMAFIKGILAEFFYEIITLSSPVQRFDSAREAELNKAKDYYDKLNILDADTISPGETLIKPVMPLYFSPKCNVLYPKMYDSISVNDVYSEAPTRVEVLMSEVGSVLAIPTTFRFRSPPSLRDALLARQFDNSKDVVNPLDTYKILGNTVAPHEIGRGVKAHIINAPSWMTIIAQKGEDGQYKEGFKELLTQYADYEYSIAVTSTRTGQVNGVFNPYIIPGYPMDIVDPGVYRPSYHAFCTSVTHNISSSGSITTSIGFTNAMTYDELYSVDTPMSLPWLNEVLGMSVDNSSVPEALRKVQAAIPYAKLTHLEDSDSKIIEAANTYYSEVLGIGAAFPDALSQYRYWALDESPSKVLNGDIEAIITTTQSPEESITLCRRPIQSKSNVAAVHAVTFIDTEVPQLKPVGSITTGEVFRQPSGADTTLDISFSRTKNGKLASGFNAFLYYDGFEIKEVTVEESNTTPVATNKGNQSAKDAKGFNSTKVGSYTYFELKTDWVNSFASFKGKYPTVAAAIDLYESGLRSSFSDYPHNLLKQIIFVESSYNPEARNAYAFGLGQLTFKYFLKKYPEAFASTVNGYTQNAKQAANYLSRLKRSFPTFTWNDVAVAYNQGEGTVLKAKVGSSGSADYSKCTLDHGGVVYFNKVFDSSKPKFPVTT